MPKYEIVVEEITYKTYYVETDTEAYESIKQEFYRLHPQEKEDALAEVEQSQYAVTQISRMEEEEA
jgi:hypothetical protein